MLDALAEHFRRECDVDAPAGRPVHLGDAARLHRHDRPARARARRARRVRARAARRSSTAAAAASMRLNFSGVGEDDIREGVRRIGEVVREQVELYGTLTGTHRAVAPPAEPAPAEPDAELADVLHLPRAASAAGGARRRARDEPRRGPQGRALARAPGLAEVGRAGRGRARAPRPRGRSAIDVGHDLVERLREAAPDVAFVALHGRDGEDGTVQELLEVARHPVHRLGRVGAASAAPTRSSPSTRCATPASRRRTSSPSTRRRSRSSAPPTRCRRSRSGCGFPIVVKPADQGSALGIKFARTAAGRARRARRRVLLRRQGAARAPRRRARPRGLDLDGEPLLPVVEAVPREEDFYDFEARYEIGRTDVRLPGRAARRARPTRAQELALQRLGTARLPRLRARRPHARRRDAAS